MKYLKNNKGQIGIEICLMTLFSMMVIVLAFNAFSCFIKKNDLDLFAEEMVKTAAFYGDTNHPEVQACYERLKEDTGLDPTFQFSPSGKVKLGNVMKITMEYTIVFDGTGKLKIPIDVESVKTEISREYKKPEIDEP